MSSFAGDSAFHFIGLIIRNLENLQRGIPVIAGSARPPPSLLDLNAKRSEAFVFTRKF